MADSATLTEYERRRLENIKRNAEMMNSLKIQSGVNELYKRQRNETKITKENKKSKSDQNPPSAIRRSLRNQNQKPKSDDQKSPQQIKLGHISMTNACFESSLHHHQHLIDTIKDMSTKTNFKLRGSTKMEKFNNTDNNCGVVDSTLLDLGSYILKPENIVRLVSRKIMNMNFFPCNIRNMVVAGSRIGDLAIWDIDLNNVDTQEDKDEDDEEGIYLYKPHTGSISGISIQPFSLSKVATSSFDGTIRLMDIEKESFDLVYSNNDAVSCLSQRPNDVNSLYFGEARGKINVHDMRAGISSISSMLHDDTINTIDFSSANTNWMATSSNDGTTCIWDLRSISRNKVKPLKMVDHRATVYSAYFSPSGNLLATTSGTNKIVLLKGVDFVDVSVIDHDNQTADSCVRSRAIWGCDDSHLLLGGGKKGVDIIPTSYRKKVTLKSPLVSSGLCTLAAHPYKFGTIAGATHSSGQVYTWISDKET